MNLLKKVFIVVLIFFVENAISQQSSKDSLLQIVMSKTANFRTSDTLHVQALNLLAKKYSTTNTDSLLLFSEKAIDISKSIGYSSGELTALINLASFTTNRGDLTKTISYYKKAKEIAFKLNKYTYKLFVLRRLSNTYVYTGNHTEALKGYLEAIDLAKKNNDKKPLGGIYLNIATLYHSQNDYQDALSFYQMASDMSLEIDDFFVSAQASNNLAIVYSSIKEYEKAMQNIDKAILYFEENKKPEWLVHAYAVKGSIYLGQKKYSNSLEWYDKSLNSNLNQGFDDDLIKANVLIEMANANLGLKKKDLAENQATEGFNLAKKMNSLEVSMLAAEVLYHIKKEKGKNKEALKYLEIQKEASDSITKSGNKQTLALFKAKTNYENEKEKIVAENEKKLARQRLYSIFSIIIFVVLLALAIPLFLKHKKLGVLFKELKKSNNTKDKLYSVIGHDLKGPISGLQSLLTLFDMGAIKNEELLGFIPKLRKDVDGIFFTLNNLLEWGKSQLEGDKTEPTFFKLQDIIENNKTLLSELAAKKSITITNDISTNVPLFADQNQIDIVIRNLMSNAIKFTPKNGSIHLKCIEENNFFEISITDNGIGMPEEVSKKIFEDDSKITTFGTENEKGTGLGLTLCKEMVEKNRGTIWVESTLNKGSIFYFTIPKRTKPVLEK